MCATPHVLVKLTQVHSILLLMVPLGLGKGANKTEGLSEAGALGIHMDDIESPRF
tara:strand:- start:318 stop:482 length:165 start_codon:yes stop_codon:yes gene_type:complete